ncbi:MAG: N(G),N(G)-dimethylarginine dimethylaminohydrolase [Chloroflexi bacterium]|nr:N(G),N(G)-dimethylarginine dimethylaminohydrolase [Chloroflexota bacterium]
MRFTHAIVRPPAPNFADGLTTAGLGPPDYELALKQHERYCFALQQCGLALTRLPPDPSHPDSTFVEDTAILTPRGAMLTRPGAPSRLGEVAGMREILTRFYPTLASIQAPGTLDGGDVCDAEGHFFIGISERTNEEGAQQLAEWLAQLGYASTSVDIRRLPGLLHLKSGLAYLGDNRLVVVDTLADQAAFHGYELVRVPVGEEYAANCVRVNEHVLVAAGYPMLETLIRNLGYPVIVLDVSEYRKMDGGLSCLSLRF